MSGEDRKRIYYLKNELIALENSLQVKQAEVINAENATQAAQKEAIENLDDTILDQFKELNDLLNPNVLAKYPDLQETMRPGYGVLAVMQRGEATTPEQNATLAGVTENAVEYLKRPQNRQVLVELSQEIKSQDPASYDRFKSFLIAQDQAAFTPAFEEIERSELYIDVALDGDE